MKHGKHWFKTIGRNDPAQEGKDNRAIGAEILRRLNSAPTFEQEDADLLTKVADFVAEHPQTISEGALQDAGTVRASLKRIAEQVRRTRV